MLAVEKILNQYLKYCKEDRTDQLKWAKDEIRSLKKEASNIKRARITSQNVYNPEIGSWVSFSSKGEKQSRLFEAQRKVKVEEQRIKDLRDRTKPHYAYTQFKRPPNDYNGTTTPFEVGSIYHHYSVHRVIKVLEDGCLAELNWEISLGGGEVQPHTTHVVVRRHSTEGLIDGGPVSFNSPLYVATTESVQGRTYPVLVPLELSISVLPSEESIQPK